MAESAGNKRPIVIRKVKKVVGGGHHGGAWKVAYADFVTAMMAFFMLLWLVANPDKVRLKGLAEYFSPSPPVTSPSTTVTDNPGQLPGVGGHGRRVQADSPKSVGQPTAEAGTEGTARGGTADVPDAARRVMAEELRLALEPADTPSADRGHVSVTHDRDGTRISLMDTANRSMFRSGTAELNDFAIARLRMMAGRLGQAGVPLAIEGHTDSAGGNSEGNWQLSAQRALAARRVLVAGGVPPERLTEIVAMAGAQPLYPDAPDRPENRRITIVVMGEAAALPSDASFAF